MKIFFTFLLSVFLISCSSRYMYQRGTFSEDREGYIRLNWNKADEDIKSAFLDKKICLGMHKRMVMGSFGPPDNNPDDKEWTFSLKSGKIGTVKFNNKDIAVEITKNLLGNPKVDDSY